MLEKHNVWSVFCGKTSAFFSNLVNKRKLKDGFTLTEMLLALVVIAVLSVLILPVVTTRSQNKSFALSYEAQVKQLLSSFVALHVLENKTDIRDTMMSVQGQEPENFANSAGAYLKKYMKVSHYCGNSPGRCFANRYFKFEDKDKIEFSKNALKGACAILKNGVSICLKPQVVQNNVVVQPISGWLDLNGPQGPNVYGKDLRTFHIDLNDRLVYNEEDAESVLLPDGPLDCPDNDPACKNIPSPCLSDPTSEECCKNKIIAAPAEYPNPDLCCRWYTNPSSQYYSNCFRPEEPPQTNCRNHSITGPNDDCCKQNGGEIEDPACCRNTDHSDYCCQTANANSEQCCKNGITKNTIFLHKNHKCCTYDSIKNEYKKLCVDACEWDQQQYPDDPKWREKEASAECCDYLSRRKEVIKVGSVDGAGPKDACCMYEDVYSDEKNVVSADYCCRLQKFPVVALQGRSPSTIEDLCCSWRFTDVDLAGKSWLKTHSYSEAPNDRIQDDSSLDYDDKKFDSCCPYALQEISKGVQDVQEGTLQGVWGNQEVQTKVWNNCCTLESLGSDWEYTKHCCHFFVHGQNTIYGKQSLMEVDPRDPNHGAGVLRAKCCGLDEFKDTPECCSASIDGWHEYRQEMREVCCMPNEFYTSELTNVDKPAPWCCINSGEKIQNEGNKWFWKREATFKNDGNRLDGCCDQGLESLDGKQLRKYEKWQVNCCYKRYVNSNAYDGAGDFVHGCCGSADTNPTGGGELWPEDLDNNLNEDCCMAYGSERDYAETGHTRDDERWWKRCCSYEKNSIRQYQFYYKDAGCCRNVDWVLHNEGYEGTSDTNNCCYSVDAALGNQQLARLSDTSWLSNCCEYIDMYAGQNDNQGYKAYVENCCFNDRNTEHDGNRLSEYGGIPNNPRKHTFNGEPFEKHCCDSHIADSDGITPSEKCCWSFVNENGMTKDFDEIDLSENYRGHCCKAYGDKTRNLITNTNGAKMRNQITNMRCSELWICAENGTDLSISSEDTGNAVAFGLPSCCEASVTHNGEDIWKKGCCESPRSYRSNAEYRATCCNGDYSRHNPGANDASVVPGQNNSIPHPASSTPNNWVYCCDPDIADNGGTPKIDCCKWFKVNGSNYKKNNDSLMDDSIGTKGALSENYQMACCNQSSGDIAKENDLCPDCRMRWLTGKKYNKVASDYGAPNAWKYYDFAGCCTSNFDVFNPSGTAPDAVLWNVWQDNCCSYVSMVSDVKQGIDEVNGYYGTHENFRAHCCTAGGSTTGMRLHDSNDELIAVSSGETKTANKTLSRFAKLKQYIANLWNSKIAQLRTLIAKVTGINISSRKTSPYYDERINKAAAKKLTKGKYSVSSAAIADSSSSDHSLKSGVKNTPSWHCCIPNDANPSKECCLAFEANDWKDFDGQGYLTYEYKVRCCSDHHVCPPITECTPDDVSGQTQAWENCKVMEAAGDAASNPNLWAIPECCACIYDTKKDHDTWKATCCPKAANQTSESTMKELTYISTHQEFRQRCCTGGVQGSDGSVIGASSGGDAAKDERCCNYVSAFNSGVASNYGFCCGKKANGENTQANATYNNTHKWGLTTGDNAGGDTEANSDFRNSCCMLLSDNYCSCDGLYNKKSAQENPGLKLYNAYRQSKKLNACCGDLYDNGKSNDTLLRQACCPIIQGKTGSNKYNSFGGVNSDDQFRSFCCYTDTPRYSCFYHYDSGQCANDSGKDERCCKYSPTNTTDANTYANAFCCAKKALGGSNITSGSNTNSWGLTFTDNQGDTEADSLFRKACCLNISDNYCTCAGLYDVKYGGSTPNKSKLSEIFAKNNCCADLYGKRTDTLLKEVCCPLSHSDDNYGKLTGISSDSEYRGYCCNTSSYPYIYNQAGTNINDWRCCTKPDGNMPASVNDRKGNKSGVSNSYCCGSWGYTTEKTNQTPEVIISAGCCMTGNNIEEGKRLEDVYDAKCCSYTPKSTDPSKDTAASAFCCDMRSKGVNVAGGSGWSPWIEGGPVNFNNNQWTGDSFRKNCCEKFVDTGTGGVGCTCEYLLHYNKVDKLSRTCCQLLLVGYGNNYGAGIHATKSPHSPADATYWVVDSQWSQNCCEKADPNDIANGNDPIIGSTPLKQWRSGCCETPQFANQQTNPFYNSEDGLRGCCTYRGNLIALSFNNNSIEPPTPRGKNAFLDTFTVDGCCGSWNDKGATDETLANVYKERCCHKNTTDSNCCKHMYDTWTDEQQRAQVFSKDTACCANQGFKNMFTNGIVDECLSKCEHFHLGHNYYYSNGRKTLTHADKVQCCRERFNHPFGGNGDDDNIWKNQCCHLTETELSGNYAVTYPAQSYAAACCDSRKKTNGGYTVYYYTEEAYTRGSCPIDNTDCSKYNSTLNSAWYCPGVDCNKNDTNDFNKLCCNHWLKNNKLTLGSSDYYTCCAQTGFTDANQLSCTCHMSPIDSKISGTCCNYWYDLNAISYGQSAFSKCCAQSGFTGYGNGICNCGPSVNSNNLTAECCNYWYNLGVLKSGTTNFSTCCANSGFIGYGNDICCGNSPTAGKYNSVCCDHWYDNGSMTAGTPAYNTCCGVSGFKKSNDPTCTCGETVNSSNLTAQCCNYWYKGGASNGVLVVGSSEFDTCCDFSSFAAHHLPICACGYSNTVSNCNCWVENDLWGDKTTDQKRFCCTQSSFKYKDSKCKKTCDYTWSFSLSSNGAGQFYVYFNQGGTKIGQYRRLTATINIVRRCQPYNGSTAYENSYTINFPTDQNPSNYYTNGQNNGALNSFCTQFYSYTKVTSPDGEILYNNSLQSYTDPSGEVNCTYSY